MSEEPMNTEPTYTMRLHIDNDPFPHYATRELAAEAAREWTPNPYLADHYGDPDEGPHRRRAARIQAAADALAEWMEEQLVEPLEHGDALRSHNEWTRLLTLELITDAIRATDWRAIADSYAEEAAHEAARDPDTPDPYADPPNSDDEDDEQ